MNDPAEHSDQLQSNWLAEHRQHEGWVREEDAHAFLQIDGDVIAGRRCQEHSWWAARCIRDDVVITVVGKEIDLEELTLITVSDLGPFLQRRMKYLRELREGGYER